MPVRVVETATPSSQPASGSAPVLLPRLPSLCHARPARPFWFLVLEEGRHLVDDCLTVLCDVTVDDHLPLRAAEVAAPLETAAAAPTVDLHLRESLAAETADVTVHAGGETSAAHRRVLEAGSPVFKAELEKTATTGELHIADMDAETFKAVLCFIYTEALPPSDSNQQVEATTMAERLLVAADRYGLEKLKRACEKTLCRRVDVDSVAAMVELSERHGCAVLKEACMRFLSCPDNLRLFVSQKRIIEKQLGHVQCGDVSLHLDTPHRIFA